MPSNIEPTGLSRRRLMKYAGAAAVAGNFGGLARAQSGALKIGILGDMTGPYADISGQGVVTAGRMAIQDFGNTVLGRPIELVIGDHQQKTDVGVTIAREWFERGGVNMITDFANSSIALAVQAMLLQVKKLAIYTDVSSTDVTGKACNPFGIHWAHDGYASTSGLIKALIAQNLKTYYFISQDAAFGRAIVNVATNAITAAGGKVLGESRHPIGTLDFSAFLLAAQTSKADVIVMADGNADLINALKQAQEFNVAAKQQIVSPAFQLQDIQAAGLDVTQGLTLTQSSYWDMNDGTRALSKRYFAQMQSMPSDPHLSVYSAVLNYLRAVAQAGTDDALAVSNAIREMKISDPVVPDGKVRADNKLVFDRYLVRVKSTAESKYPWDYFKILNKIPAEDGFKPLLGSECPMVKA